MALEKGKVKKKDIKDKVIDQYYYISITFLYTKDINIGKI